MATTEQLRPRRSTPSDDEGPVEIDRVVAVPSRPTTLRRAWRRGRGVVARIPWALRQSLLALVLIATYFLVRGVTEGAETVAVAHAHGIEALERYLGISVEARLQSAASEWDLVIDVANWIYIWGHWPVIAATLVWLVARHRDRYRRLRDAMVISGLLAMAVFVNYPVAPPRLATDGLVDTVTKHSSAYRILQPPAFVDRYAAMPSLHVGWDLLVGIAIATTAGVVAVRALGWMLPPLMALAVVVTANHYVLDVVVGVAFVLVGHACALQLERRRERRDDRHPEHPREHRSTDPSTHPSTAP